MYRARLPNGANVAGVAALGHVNPKGGGARNAFGRDFATLGQKQWTVALCRADSDDDGFTNGQELGDPCCIWTSDNTDELVSTGVSHPGDPDSVPTNPLLIHPDCSGISSF